LQLSTAARPSMTLRRGFNRLFIVLFVSWNLWNCWIVFRKAREAAALAHDGAEDARAYCISCQKCPPRATGTSDTAKTQDATSDPHVISLDQIQNDQECMWCQFPSNIDCQATFNQEVSQHTIWREFRNNVTGAKLLTVEGIPAAIYILCWIVVATVLWIARGFGKVGGNVIG
jgi:hypothetical protein